MNWLLRFDERAFLAINGLGSRAWDPFFQTVTWLGNGLVLALVVLGPLLLFDRPRLRRFGLALVLSVVAGALVVEAVKWGADRERPIRHFASGMASGEVAVRVPGEALRDRSFPSGHTQAAFGAAMGVFLLHRGFGILALVLACLVGWSRIYLGVHFPLDMVVGAGIGVLFSWLGMRVPCLRLIRRG